MSIGFILSLLLIYIGFRIVQKRGSQASAVENFTCVRTKDTEARCTWTNRTEEQGNLLASSMPPGGLSECNLVFIHSEAGAPVALGDGNYEHTVIMQPLVANQSYCAAPAGSEETLIEVPASPDGAAGGQSTDGTGGVVLDVTPTTAVVVPEPTSGESDIVPTTAPLPTSAQTASDTEVDAFYKDDTNADSDWGDCLDYFEKKGYQVSGNACIKGYYRHTTTPTPASS
ncbi:MAG: hypothetical protein UZ22_OP11002000381 [Microgenomates bacterium OLB23]|nr:MAG: hypothetical protein UZ22_OP11002000381 [Microgenomates bacterium OLB23]